MTIYDNLIVGCIAMVQENSLDLGREYVDALDNKHVVRTAERLRHLYKCTSAGALLSRQDADILRAIAEKRERFLGKCSKYELTLLSVREYFPCLWINDFDNKIVLVDMHAVLIFALERNTGA